eukprot:TRINITY_DN3539_c0_g1_i1.p1 TRINITY_DN3539_c0_g1~~TRINITY_DN3539_c0_g1_i1.p1  ORF type:complete len:381 (-),score=98.48 TRINITY_DN3539_c0_g1_i1:48-1190(-)
MTDADNSANNSNSNSDKRTKYYVGTNALNYYRPFMEVESPLENGLVSNWEGVEQLWEHIYNARLRVNSNEHPLLLAEPSFNTRALREKTTELMFEKYKIPALFLSKNAVLTSFASGKTTAVVIDSGGGITSVVPVQDGFALKKAIVSSTLAGNRLTEELQKVLQKKGHSIKPSFMITRKEIRPSEFQVKLKDCPNTSPSFMNFMVSNVVRDIKETACRVSETPFDEVASASMPTTPYELPDGNTIEIGPDRFSIPELMFDPSPINVEGMTFSGVHNMISDSVSKCDNDVRRELYSNVIATGGNTLIPGFTDRLQSELAPNLPSQNSYKLKIFATGNSTERKFSTWIGGSILASAGSFHQMWISTREYEEHGAGIVERKCP